jgi:hypothetical protein
LKRKIFNPDTINDYVEKACIKYVKKNGTLKSEFYENEENKEIKELFIEDFGKISQLLYLHLADTELSKSIYNMLVLSGTFRTIALVFFIYSGFIFVGYFCFSKPLVFFTPDCREVFTFWVVFGISSFISIFSFMIYCKYLRRHIEKSEAAIVLYDFNSLKNKDNTE